MIESDILELLVYAGSAVLAGSGMLAFVATAHAHLARSRRFGGRRQELAANELPTVDF